MSGKTEMRVERDSIGEIEVPAQRYWGAQTQRCLSNFDIGWEGLPPVLIRAFAFQKMAAAQANMNVDVLDERRGDAICQAAWDVLDGKLSEEFPIRIWQTGSGTQTNMNVNEVLASRANEILSGKRGTDGEVHPNDHVNRSQSSNDSFPTVMHIAIALQTHDLLWPSLDQLHKALLEKADEFDGIMKVGRTHLQDAVPISLGTVFAVFAQQVATGKKRLEEAWGRLMIVPQGGTAVGNGANCPPGFVDCFIEHIRKLSGFEFCENPLPMEGLATHDALVEFSGQLNALAVSLNKIANDIRLLGSGPRCGIGELLLPANEPGSSIMPGKVNPTQAEALSQICAQVMGNHVSVTVGGAHGHFELNTYKPLIVYNILQSVQLLADGMRCFTSHCVEGIKADKDRIQQHLDQTLMVVTALAPTIGYERAAEVAKKAHHEKTSIKQAALDLQVVSEEDYDRLTSLENWLK
ncbi:MAG: class II fumarate hydratase [Terasakiella sp.]|uniref:class II fumarate hydratase n=1 Tax=unclassified Terasakiella TaxID=2614952 RepID=UPI003AFF9C18